MVGGEATPAVPGVERRPIIDKEIARFTSGSSSGSIARPLPLLYSNTKVKIEYKVLLCTNGKVTIESGAILNQWEVTVEYKVLLGINKIVTIESGVTQHQWEVTNRHKCYFAPMGGHG